jgi:DNA polymerase I-like protein with 3'-5' exonuclease and polymerase domains
MAKVALVEAKPSRTDFVGHFDNSFEFDRYSLSSDPSLKKVLKKDVDIEMDIDSYDWIILVGSECLKFYTNVTSIMEYSGKVVDKKFIPVINPAMIAFKPEVKKLWDDSKSNIQQYISGQLKVVEIDESMAFGITDSREASRFIIEARDCESEYVALDSETTGLYPRDGHMIGISLSYDGEKGAYIDCDCIDATCEALLQQVFDKKIVVFHNGKFDISWFEYHFKFKFPRFEDTMLQHYLLDENPGTHGLKQLSLKHTKYGDYEKPMYDWIDNFRRSNGILKADFTWDMIPFDVMKTYAAMDAVCTFILHGKFKKALDTNKKLTWVYENILKPGCRFLIDAENNGVPFDRQRLVSSQTLMADVIEDAAQKLDEYKEVQAYKQATGDFNPNSTKQLRELLFDYIGLAPTGKKTGTGAESTDAESLGNLAEEHPVPQLILNVRQNVKIKTTYIDKIIPALDRDGRLRTNFNIHGTTSGRLSSSGKLNMQQLPRDNPIVKGCMKAKPGNKIVAMDLTTAEVYCAAVLAKDENLKDVFRSGGNFHSNIAKLVFGLPCEADKVAELYPMERQAAKAVTFGIMYGAGPQKISWQVTKDSGTEFTVREAKEVIDDYFKQFSALRKWIDNSQNFIRDNGFIYSFFGRKRRLPNVASKDKGVASHEVRSGLNFLVQSVASDVNLLGAIDAHNEVLEKKIPAKIFALVHDSILAEVQEDAVEEYCEILIRNVQKDRGLSIADCPIGCDFDIGDDYSFGKFEAKYGL